MDHFLRSLPFATYVVVARRGGWTAAVAWAGWLLGLLAIMERFGAGVGAFAGGLGLALVYFGGVSYLVYLLARVRFRSALQRTLAVVLLGTIGFLIAPVVTLASSGLTPLVVVLGWTMASRIRCHLHVDRELRQDAVTSLQTSEPQERWLAAPANRPDLR